MRQNVRPIRPVPPSVAGRVPAHDLDAEAAVLSALMLDAGRVDEVIGWLRPDHFYSDANGRIYEAIVELHEQRRTVDCVSIAGELRARERLAQIGGASYIAQLADATPAVAHVADHASIIVDHATTRRVASTCQRIQAEAYGDIGDPREWALSSSSASPVSAYDSITGEDGTSAREAIRALADEYAHPERRVTIRSGLRTIDNMIDGLQPGHLVIFGAHSSHGKSALALNVAVHVALRERWDGAPCGVAYYTLEMPAVDLMRRAAANLAGFSARRLRTGITEEQERRFVSAMNELQVDHFRLIDRTSQSMDQVRLSAARYASTLRRAGTPLRLVVIDYAQLLQSTDRRRDVTREQEVAAIGRAAKILAGDLGVTVILLSQLNAESIKESRLPRSTDLRESKALTNDANAVVLVWNPMVIARQEKLDAGERLPPVNEQTIDRCTLVAGKVRDGEPCWIDIGYRPALTRFVDLQRSTD